MTGKKQYHGAIPIAPLALIALIIYIAMSAKGADPGPDTSFTAEVRYRGDRDPVSGCLYVTVFRHGTEPERVPCGRFTHDDIRSFAAQADYSHEEQAAREIRKWGKKFPRDDR